MKEFVGKAPVIGFVRYSQKVKFANGEKERNVFDPEYFEYRFRIFQNITLKSFQQQTNGNFVLLLLHSENMPSHYKERFIELEKTNQFLYNVFMEDTHESFIKTIRNSIEYVSFEKDAAITFRIDNDDAVQNDFIQKLSNFLKNDFIGYAVCMPNIYRIKRVSETSYMIEEHYSSFTSIGLAYITNREQYKTVMELGDHSNINKETPLILIAGSAGGLMTINGENAANVIDKAKANVYGKQDMEAYLLKRKLNDLGLDHLHILPETNDFSVKKIVKLLIPPVFIHMRKKLVKSGR